MPDHPDSPVEVDLTPGGRVTPDQRLSDDDRTALWWLLAIVLVIQAVGLFSPGTGSEPGPVHVDKAVHATIFGLPVYLLGRLTGRKWLWAAVFVGYAALSEVIQYLFVPARAGDVFDFTADLVGIAIALVALRRSRTAA